MNFSFTAKTASGKRLSDLLFILWAGGAALLSYSLVYALRKPYTAAAFEGLEFFNMDYKVAVTIVQILGYLIAKFAGIKLISELKKETRFRFIVIASVMAELALVGFWLLPAPYNLFVMFFNGLALGCMWGVIFSFIEGRRVTDLLASMLGVSIVFSSGTAKSIGLFFMNTLHVDPFLMPVLIGGLALPLLLLLGYSLSRLPQPDEHDIASKSKRETLNGKQRWELFRQYMPMLTLLLAANFLLVILRDIKEDFLVNIFDVSAYSSWIFARIDSIVTLIILGIFGLMMFVKSNIKSLMVLLSMVIVGMVFMGITSFGYSRIQLSPISWLFIQSLCLYIAFLTFQTIFFDRFIACFKIKGCVGFFIALIDFIGYTGTVLVLTVKEFMHPDINWLEFYNLSAGCVSLFCCVAFTGAMCCLWSQYRKKFPRLQEAHPEACPVPPLTALQQAV